MSEQKHDYNPNELSEEEIKEMDKKAAAERAARLENLEDRNLRSKIIGRFNVHTKSGLPRRGRYVEEKTEYKEMNSKDLNKEIKKLLEQYKFTGGFKLSSSHETKGNYVFKLLVRSVKSAKYETELEFEDAPEKIAPRLREYMDNTYDRL